MRLMDAPQSGDAGLYVYGSRFFGLMGWMDVLCIKDMSLWGGSLSGLVWMVSPFLIVHNPLLD